MIKWLILTSTLALTGCCASSNGCYSPLPGAPIAWDGVGANPNTVDYKPRRRSRRSHEIILGPLNDKTAQSETKAQSSDRWEQEQAADKEAEKTLTRHLKICANC